MLAECTCCRIVEDLREGDHVHDVGRHWTLNANVDSGARPSMVLQTRRHLPTLGQLDPAERQEFARFLPRLTEQLQSDVGADRVYVLFLGEGEPQHLHAHLVPRFPHDPEGDPVGLIARPLPPDATELDKPAVAARLGRHSQEAHDPSRLVRSLISVLRAFEKLALYNRVFTWGPAKRVGRSAQAETYVLGWLAILSALLPAAVAPAPWRWFALAIAVWRFVDLMTMHLLTLLDRSRQRLVSFQRSFVLAILNLAEIAIIVAVTLRAAMTTPLATAAMRGFDVITLRAPTSQPGWTADLVTIGGTTGALLVLSGVFSLVLGLLSQSYVETRDG